MDYIEMARKMRPLIEAASKELDDDTASAVPYFFVEWKPNTAYDVGDRIRYGETLYKVLQAHTSQISWEPNTSVSLYAKVLPGQDGDIGEWVQPDSTNAYMKGDKVKHNGQTWESLIDNNVWEPGAVGTETLWVAV